MTGQVSGALASRRLATAGLSRRLACGVACAAHLLLDWLGDRTRLSAVGIQVLWPFSDRWFISGWNSFRRSNGAIFSARRWPINAESCGSGLLMGRSGFAEQWLRGDRSRPA